MPEAEKNVKISLGFDLDQVTANKVAAAIEALAKKGKQAGKQTVQVEGVLEAVGKLQQVGLIITGAAAGLNAAMLVSARSYVANVGTAEQASRRWLGASKSLEISQMKIGRAVTESVVPALEKAAELAERAAKWANDPKNAGAVKAGTYAIGGAAIAGGTLTAIAGIANGLASLKGLLGTGGALAGLGTLMKGAGSVLGPAAGVAGSVLGGYGLATFAYDQGWKKQLGREGGPSGGQIMGQLATSMSYSLGELFGKGPEFGKFMGKLTGAIQDTGSAAGKSATELDATANQVAAYHSYMRQTQEAERTHKRTLFTMNRDFQRQMEYAETDYLKGRQRAMRDFARSERLAEADYYRSRRLAARDFNIQMERTEYDHQKDLRRGKEDHEWRLKRIIMEGDGMAFWEENRQYELSRSRGEEDFNMQLSRQNEDFAKQRADQEQEYAIQRTRRLEEFEISRKDQETDFNIQRKRSQDQFKLQLQDMAYQFGEERRLRMQALIDQFRDQKDMLERERIMRLEFSQAMLDDLARAQNLAERGTNLLGNPAGSNAAGGYMPPGTYRIHKKEFVLNAESTGAAERLMGESLSQSNLLAALAGGNRQSGGFTYQDNRVFSRGLTPEEKLQIRRETENLLMEVVSGTAL